MEELEPEVKFLRLSNGEDIISEIIEIEEDETQYITLVNPMKVIYLPGTNPGSLTVSMMQWVFPRICTVQNFNINYDDILTIGIPSNAMIAYYYGTVEHFSNDEKVAKNFEFPELEEEEQETLDDTSGLDMLNEFLETRKNGKKTLH